MLRLGLEQWQQGGGSLDFAGRRLFTRVEGEGPALMLIHGFPTSSYDWAAVWPVLVRQFRMHALDMLGFGLSDKPAGHAYCVADSADQFVALASSRSLQSVHVVSHDYGDTVAQELLARQLEGRLPFRIQSIAFLNGGLFPEATFPLLVQRLLLGPFGSLVARVSSEARFVAGMRHICSQPLPAGELHEHWQLLERGGGKRVLPKLIGYIRERARHRERWVGALCNAGIPICLIDGVDDPVSGASIVRRWRELLPRDEVVELAGVGHYPQWEAPAKVLAGLHSFHANLPKQ